MKENEDEEFGKNIDIRKIFFRALDYWFIFPIFIILSAAYAIYSYKTTTPLYKISTRIMIGKGQSLGEGIGAAGPNSAALPSVMLSNTLYENQQIMLTSRIQIEKALRQLDFGVSYYKVDRYREIEIYKNSPFQVLIDSTEIKPIYLYFDVQFISKDQLKLTSLVKGIEFSQEVKFFEKIENPNFAFSIVPDEQNIDKSDYIGSQYRFSISTMNRLVSQYQSKVKLEPVKGGASILEMYVFEGNVNKGIDFLNKLAQTAVNYSLEKKNQIASNTIDFIERQLAGVSDSLSRAQNVLEEFKSRHAIMDASLQGQTLLTQSKELEDKLTQLKTSMEYYNSLEEYLESNRNIQSLAAPSTQGITDPAIIAYIGELSKYYTDRSQLLFNSSAENPLVVNLNRTIETLKRTIIEAIKNAKSTTQFSIDELSKQMYGLMSDVKNFPKQGQMLANIEKKFQMNDEMHAFLMQKRSEAQMAKASNLPDNEIVEEALYKGQIAPDLKKNIMIVVIGGLVVPAVLIFLIIFLNDKVQDITEIKEITSAPIIGQIPIEKTNGTQKAALSSDNPNTILAEAFRSIRFSLGFYASNKKTKTILFTSTLPGEGKSFCTINVAHSFAQLGKKTILMEFDLRRPSIARQSGLKVRIGEQEGLSNYYTGEHDLDKIIYKDTGVPNFHIIFSGQIPPNPAELIASEETALLISKLQELYDIVIIDTPPLGLVSDAHLLANYADVNLLVVRHNSTPKQILKMNLRDEKTKNMHALAIILNGIPFQKREYNYQYGYSMRNKYITRKA